MRDLKDTREIGDSFATSADLGLWRQYKNLILKVFFLSSTIEIHLVMNEVTVTKVAQVAQTDSLASEKVIGFNFEWGSIREQY